MNTDYNEIREILREATQNIRDITERQKEAKQESDIELKNLRRIVGDIGNKFGSFTEGMAFPSMERVLRKQFGMTTVTTNYKTHYGSDTLKIDVLGIANGTVNAVVIVEVKSHLTQRDIEQTLNAIETFKRLHPEYAGKKIFGVIACVSGAMEQKQKAIEAGLFVASTDDEIFELQTPAWFVPRDFSQPATPV